MVQTISHVGRDVARRPVGGAEVLGVGHPRRPRGALPRMIFESEPLPALGGLQPCTKTTNLEATVVSGKNEINFDVMSDTGTAPGVGR